MVLDDEALMTRALELARKSYDEGGCPIGAVLADSGSGTVLGQGHNGLVQEGNPIVHGEMAALRAAGRMKDRHRTTMYTTLQPCFMCAGMLVQFGIPRVVIGDAVNAAGPETIEFLRANGVEVTVLDRTARAFDRGPGMHRARGEVPRRTPRAVGRRLGRRAQSGASALGQVRYPIFAGRHRRFSHRNESMFASCASFAPRRHAPGSPSPAARWPNPEMARRC